MCLEGELLSSTYVHRGTFISEPAGRPAHFLLCDGWRAEGEPRGSKNTTGPGGLAAKARTSP